MHRLLLALAVAMSFSGPVAAQSLSTLLPQISFPETITGPSTKDCLAERQACQFEE